MVARIGTVAFQGIDVLDVDVQVQMTSGMPAFTVVGLPDKAVGESRERVRAALDAIGLGLPLKRIVVNLSPADMLKEGSHFDLPIALGLLVAMGVVTEEDVAGHVVLGELALDGSLARVAGVLPAAIGAAAAGRGIICPEPCGGEAAWAADAEVLAPRSLLALINHFRGTQVLTPPEPRIADGTRRSLDLRDIRGQETARRALEVAASGGHNLLMIGPPGAGKSMLASRLPGILPPMDAAETLSVSMVQSMAGLLDNGVLTRERPFRDPHHSASQAAMVGGGTRAKPGEVSLAPRRRAVSGRVARISPSGAGGAAAAARVRARVGGTRERARHLSGAGDVRGGHEPVPVRSSRRPPPRRARGAPRCAREYQAKISGPLLDRIDLHVDVPAVDVADLSRPPAAEDSSTVAARVAAARAVQTNRYAGRDAAVTVRTNAEADGDLLAEVARPDADGARLLADAAARIRLSARGYHRVLRVARTLADLDGGGDVRRRHIAEALGYRRIALSG